MKTDSSSFFKELFDNLANKFGMKYEYERWKKSDVGRKDYHQTLGFLLHNLDDLHFTNILEIGCGVGTWTVHLCNHCKNITLLDISDGMVELTANRLKQLNFTRVSKIVGDFQDPNLTMNGDYDAIFSIRAIEYMEDKSFVLSRMYDLLNEGGFVFVITKNPYRSLVPFLSVFKAKVGFKQPKALRHMIHYRDLAVRIQKAGFKDINVYPVIISIATTTSAYMHKRALPLSNWIFQRIYKKRLNPLYIPITESYCITARKG
jgi:ubiquinone/menaquinone biosynthesis C-methylase UbiE